MFKYRTEQKIRKTRLEQMLEIELRGRKKKKKQKTTNTELCKYKAIIIISKATRRQKKMNRIRKHNTRCGLNMEMLMRARQLNH